MIPDFKKRQKRKKQWKLEEKRVSRAFLGQNMPNSGGSTDIFKKGDVKNEELLIEVKTTSKTTYSVSYEVLSKICREAKQNSRNPVLLFVFLKDRAIHPFEENKWVMIPEKYFKELYESRRSEEAV